MYFFKRLIIFTIIAFISGVSFVYSQRTDYKPFTNEQLNCVVSSNTRYNVSLSANWEISFNEKEWNSYIIPNSNNTEEQIIYRRNIKIDRNLIRNYKWHLSFWGLEDQVEIYINDQFLGREFSSMAPFMIKIPDKMLLDDNNSIKLVVTKASEGLALARVKGIYNKKYYSGILRDIILVGTPSVWISNLNHTVNFSSNYNYAAINASISVSSGDLKNQGSKQASTDSLFALGRDRASLNIECFLRKKTTNEYASDIQTKTIEINSERTVNHDIKLNVNLPILWTIQNPYLYELVVKLTKNGTLIDEFKYDMGFKEVKIVNYENKNQIFLNGQPLEIKGVDYIEDYYSSGQTLSAYRMENDISQIKTLGANLIRFKYSFPHPYMASLCDKNGILMMIELPVYDIPASLIGMDEIKVRMKNLASRMISAYDYHTSLLAWGLGDGLEEKSTETKDFTNEVAQVFKSGSDKLLYKVITTAVEPSSLQNIDFVGLRSSFFNKNFYYAQKDVYRITQLIGNKPIFLNYGIPTQINNHNGYSDALSLESQAYQIKAYYLLAKQMQLSGSVIWSYNDYYIENSLLVTNNDDMLLCTSGLLSRDRQQRLSYKTLKALFNEEKLPLLNPGSYSERIPYLFIITGLLLSIVLISMIKRFRRFREYIFRALLRPYNFYADIRDQRIISHIQTLSLGFIISLSYGIYLASILYYFKNSELAQYFISLFIPSSGFQEFFYRMIWMPELLALLITLFFFVGIFIISAIIKVFSIFVSGKIYFSDTMVITVWSALPAIILLPFAIIINRLLLISPFISFLFLLFFIAIFVWILLRIIRSTAVVFDIRQSIAYSIGLGLIVIVKIFFISILNYQYHFIAYLQYFFNHLIG